MTINLLSPPDYAGQPQAQANPVKSLTEKCHSEERGDEESLCRQHFAEACFAPQLAPAQQDSH
jgi:hypothetical protein